MKYIDEFGDSNKIGGLVEEIKKIRFRQKITIMEVCGTHTMSIFENGIKGLLPADIELISGPGCPICVTPGVYIDNALELAGKDDVIIATFADLLRVPGKQGSLQKELARGSDIRIVYSPLDAVRIARENQEKEVVFLAIGFETTISTIALSIIKAKEIKLKNFSLLQSIKVMPPVLRALLMDKEVNIDGLILPGHVCTIIGSKVFNFIGEEFNTPAVVAGFEASDLLFAFYRLSKMLVDKENRVENLYPRLVKTEGNKNAISMIKNVFVRKDTFWRGLGRVPNSGLRLKGEYINYSAEEKFGIREVQSQENTGCICGYILKGKKRPPDCELFIKTCTPLNPVGPCMVSREGSCAAYYKYQRDK